MSPYERWSIEFRRQCLGQNSGGEVAAPIPALENNPAANPKLATAESRRREFPARLDELTATGKTLDEALAALGDTPDGKALLQAMGTT